LPKERPVTNAARRWPPKKAIEILTTLVNGAAELESEPFGSSKRDRWTTTARAALENAFRAESSILRSFSDAQGISVSTKDSDEKVRQIANRKLGSEIAVLQSAIEQLGWSDEGEEESTTSVQDTISRASVLIFISHSSKDAPLAQALIDLLRSALRLAADQIRCSSVDGYRLPVGVNTEGKLREEVRTARAVVGLVTPNSLASSFVMFELGARWGSNLFLAPLLAGIEPSELSGPLGLLNALSANNEAQLHQLVGDIGRELGVRVEGAASYLRQVAEVKRLTATVGSERPPRGGLAASPLSSDRLKPSRGLKIAVRLELTRVPIAGGGEDSRGEIRGRVVGLASPERYKVVLFALADKWYVQPTISNPYTDVDTNGFWKNWTHLGERYAAFVVRKTFRPPPTTDTLPDIRGDILGKCEMAPYGGPNPLP
jgi:hypothetical protein